MDLLDIGDSEISVLETRNHLVDSLGEILGVDNIRWYDNSTVVRKMSVEAEDFCRAAPKIHNGLIKIRSRQNP